jgi:hypothetical protein
MSKVVGKWQQDNFAEHDQWAAFVGFEAEIKNKDGLCEVYDEMTFVEQACLFAFVADLLDMEAGK